MKQENVIWMFAKYSSLIIINNNIILQFTLTGHVGGAGRKDNGGGANYLCLPRHPEWGNRMGGLNEWHLKLYGSEFEHTLPPIFHCITTADRLCTTSMHSASCALLLTNPHKLWSQQNELVRKVGQWNTKDIWPQIWTNSRSKSLCAWTKHWKDWPGVMPVSTEPCFTPLKDCVDHYLALRMLTDGKLACVVCSK